MKLLLPMIFFSLSLIWSCTPDEPIIINGCTDSASLNYNADATVDDGSCQYLSDLYTGVYLVSDTTTYIDPSNNQLITSTSQYTFSVSSTGNTTVNVNQFAGCSDLTAAVSETLLSFTNLANCSNIYDVVVKKDGDNLTFDYKFSTFVPNEVTGTARKQ